MRMHPSRLVTLPGSVCSRSFHLMFAKVFQDRTIFVVVAMVCTIILAFLLGMRLSDDTV